MVVDVHAHIRGRIVSGELAPESVLSQAELARQLGVSRGPVREALQRLEDEGLIEAEANRRPRVASFDPSSLDSLYGVRIVTEALGARVSAAMHDQALVDQLTELLDVMLTTDDQTEEWRRAHRRFHGAIVSGAGSVNQELTVRLAERSEPYYRLYGSTRRLGDADHQAVVDAFVAGDAQAAMTRHARHVARTALSVLASMAPEYHPSCIRAALSLVGAEASDTDRKDGT